MMQELKVTLRSEIIDKSINTRDLTNLSTGSVINLFATSAIEDKYGNIIYGTNRSFEIPEGFIGKVYPADECANKDLIFATSVQLIGNDNKDEVKLVYKKFNSDKIYTSKGDDPYASDTFGINDLVGHLIIVPAPQINIE